MSYPVPLTDVQEFNRLHASPFNPNEFKALPEYKLKVTQFANKTIRFVMYKWQSKGMIKESFSGDSTFYPKIKTDEEKAEAKAESINRAARRAKQAVHHLVRSMGADHMLTLNVRRNITDYDEFDAIFHKFIRLVREKDLVGESFVKREKKRDWAYVAVRERQERGSLHMHIACVGKQDLRLLRACWYVALGGRISDSGENTLGQINVQSNHRRFSGATENFKTFKLVAYLTKYVAKGFEESEAMNAARYKASRHIARPVISKRYMHAYFSFGDKPFIDAHLELFDIARGYGVNVAALDFEVYNIGLELLIMDAPTNDGVPF